MNAHLLWLMQAIPRAALLSILLSQEVMTQSPEQRTSPSTGSGAIAGRTFSKKQVQFAIIDGQAVFEGDIVLGPAAEVAAALDLELPDPTQTGGARSVVITGSDHRWPNATIPFDFDANLGDAQQTQVNSAISQWEQNTPIRFLRRTDVNRAGLPDFVRFTNVPDGCSSNVGRITGMQVVSIETGCGTGPIIHEIGHAVGLWHEQSRADRDDFVTINWDNIEEGREHNFNQHITDGDDVGAYDCGSIMHYNSNAFSNGTGPTITPKDPTCVIGQRASLSSGDILAVNILYPGRFADAQRWTNHYGYSQGWRVERHVRLLVDLNNDKQSDIVGFGNAGTYVSLSSGADFASPRLVLTHYGYQQGWRVDRHVRLVVDVNNDQQPDIVGFGNAGVYVSQLGGEDFAAPGLLLRHYGYNQGWRVYRHVRVMANVDDDQQPDIVGFGNAGTYLSMSSGGGFTAPQLILNNYGYDQGWRADKHVRVLADVNNDQHPDIVAFGNTGTYLSLSSGGSFSAPQLVLNKFGYDQGWRVDKHVRVLADVNGDQQADIVGFGNRGVYVSLSTGTGFEQPRLWVDNYGYSAGGWRVDEHPRALADLNGDQRADIVGFGNAGAFISISTGVNFGPPDLRVQAFGASTGWKTSRHLRTIASPQSNAFPAIVGFASGGVYVSENQLRP